MKGIKKIITGTLILGGAIAVGSQDASAQFYQAAQQLQSLISPALSGSGRYKGLVEVTGLYGVGDSKINHVEISTSQGYQYTSWFYMGAGLGVDIVHSSYTAPNTDTDDPAALQTSLDRLDRYGTKRSGVMIPVFTDFRFDIPTGSKSSSVYIDMRLGASWLCGNRYIITDGGWLGNNTNFYFRPSVGARFGINSSNPKQAVSVGVSYLLLTSNNGFWYPSQSPTLSAVGASISFEW